MPGTHCKWVQVQNGVVRQFATAMTGELHHLLLNHSLLGQQLPAQLPDKPLSPSVWKRVKSAGVIIRAF